LLAAVVVVQLLLEVEELVRVLTQAIFLLKARTTL
jgi:hypothetical protein